LLTTTLFAGVIVGLPPAAIAAPSPSPQPMTSVPMNPGQPSPPASLPDLPSYTAPGSALPAAATAEIEVAGGSRRSVGGAALVGGMPVSVTLEEFGDVQSLGGRPLASPASGATVQFTVLSQEKATAAGVKGVLFTAEPSQDLGAPVELSLGYASFAGAFGADWGQRLRLTSFPACVLTTPLVEECHEQTIVPGQTTDASVSTVTASLTLPSGSGSGSGAAMMSGGGGVYALTAGGSSESGNFGATPFNQSLSWSHGGSGGDFSTSLSVRTATVPGGLAPQLGLNYSSGSIDGLTESTNNQANLAGEGWSVSGLSYVERSYRPCKFDGVPANQGDLCFVGYAPLSLVLNGQSTRIIADSGTGAPVAENAALGWRVERLLNASNGVHEGEYFKVTTMDGAQYFFGSRARASGGGAARVPVFGNDPGEPCYNAGGFGVSGCVNMGYKWHLDYVIDRHANTMTYTWDHYVNRYGAINNVTMLDYDATSRLIEINYGSNSVLGTPASARAEFGYTYRCTDPNQTVCAANPTAAYWPDTPWDQFCQPLVATSCAGRTSPTFWTVYRLDSITSRVHNVAASIWEQVDALALNHTFPATGDYVLPAGDDSAPALWLNYGYFPGGLLAIETSGIRLANRVAWGNGQPTGLKVPMMHYRLNAFSDATGGLINVTYSGADCTPAITATINSDRNNWRCYPVWEGSAWRWYHKYVVTDVENRDRTGGSPSVWTHYEYTTEHVGSVQGQDYANALWRFDFNYLLPVAQRTYSQWRGYPVVYTRVGNPDGTGIQQVSQDVYFRGMSGDWNGRQVVTTDGTTNYDDHESLTGKLLRHTTFDGRTGPWRTMDIQRYTSIFASTMNLGVGVPAITAWRVDDTYTISKLSTPSGYQRTTEARTTYLAGYPLPSKVENFGETVVVGGTSAGTSDDTCTTTAYVTPDTTKWLINFVKESYTTNCASTPVAADYLGGERHYYDGSTTLGTLVGKGNMTETRTLKTVTAVPPAAGDWISTKATYDGHGRIVTSTDELNRLTTTTFTPVQGGPVTQVRTTNHVGWMSTSTLDIRFGTPTVATDLNGKVTRSEYDIQGRLVKVWKNHRAPTGTGGVVPDAEYRYVIRNTQPSYVGTKLLNVEGNGQMTESFTLFDSLMRPRRSESPGATGTGRMITDTVYGPAGETARTSTFFNSGAPSAGFDTFNEADSPQHTRFGYNNFAEQTLIQPYTMGSPLGATWNTVTTYDGRMTTVTPPQGGTATTVLTDSEGKTVQLRQHQGGTPSGAYVSTSYSHDRSGNLTSVTDPLGNQWQYWYDLLSRKIKTSDPDSGITETTYFDDSSVKSTKDPLTQQLWYEYDSLGRQIKLHADTATGPVRSSWTYDTATFSPGGAAVLGQLASSTRHDTSGNFVSTVSSYNNAYQPLTSTFTAPGFGAGGTTLTYTTNATYKNSGAPATAALPGAGGLPAETFTTGYNAAGLTNTLTSGSATYIGATSYDHDGALLSRTSGITSKQLRVSNTLDPATRRMTGLKAETETTGTFAEKLFTGYTYDPAGNILSAAGKTNTVADQEECYRYDYLRRLTEAWTQVSGACTTPQKTGVQPYWRTWTFDAIGNRLTQTEKNVNGTTATSWGYTVGSAGAVKPHQVKTVTATSQPTRNFTYDAAGNMLTRTSESGAAQNLTWDKEGHLASITEATVTTSYIYGVDGQRLVATSPSKQTLYLPDGTELEKLTSGGSILGQRYIGGVALRDPSGLKWTVANHQGTATAQVDAVSMAVTQRRLMPYGEARGTQPTWLGTQGYVGGTSDPSGLVHLGAREYDPSLGRFISVDPIMDMADPQQWNPYTYSNSSPVTLSDPSGLKAGNPDDGQDANGKGSTQGCNAACQAESLGIDEEALAENEINDANETLNASLWDVLAEAGVDFLLDLIGYNDAVSCFTGGSFWACASLAASFNPFGKAAKAATSLIKAFDKGIAAWKAWNKAKSVAKATIEKASARLSAAKNKLADLRSKAGKCDGNSFNPDTHVLLADGSTKEIQDIEIGDIVLATDPETDVTTGKEVTALFLNEDRQLTDITLVTADGTEVVLPTTWHHEIWAENRQAWVHAAELAPGDQLLTPTGDTVTVKFVANSTGLNYMHDLTVADIHTYYVLANHQPVLVHNCDKSLNLGSGDNPMPNAVNVDLREAPGVDVLASADALPFAGGTFDAVHAINPRFNALTPEVARVMKPGALLKISASTSNKFRPRNMSTQQLADAGFELVSSAGGLDRSHLFGVMKRENGGVIDPSKLLTWVYRRR
jgi:RHS repeat-associated protein